MKKRLIHITHNKELLSQSALDTLRKPFQTLSIQTEQQWYTNTKVCKSTFEKYKHTRKTNTACSSLKGLTCFSLNEVRLWFC